MIPREQVIAIILGTIFLFIGVAACCIAAIRGRAAGRVLAWFGVFSAMYGARLYAVVPAAFRLLAGPLWPSAPQFVWIITYVILIPALLFWAELSLGTLRRVFQIMVIPASAIALAGIFAVLLHEAPNRFMRYNNVLVICALLVLAVPNVVPSIGKRYLVIQSRVSATGILLLAIAVIHDNLSGAFLNLGNYPFLEPVAFALFVFAQGWVAAQKVVSDERRLLSIQNELAIAREIQTSILPSCVPKLTRLRISAAYCPMAAVAGDFYWFIAVDPHRGGVLVADVSGHGVPAALIASMIKVAMQSVVPCADDPRAVLCGLARALSAQLHGQFVSAAYLWLDTESRRALYSAAGHPPLLRWREGKLERIQSNGLLFGVKPDDDYPVRTMPIQPGDRFLLYTDGLTEPENAHGDSFGDIRLEQVVRENEGRPPSNLSDILLAELHQWQPTSVSQQDDITLIVIDVL